MIEYMLVHLANALLFAGIFGGTFLLNDDDDAAATAEDPDVPSDQPENVAGGSGDDLLMSDSPFGADFVAGGGNDSIIGTDFDDNLLAGTGDDTADMGQGDDRALGKEGLDILRGQGGNDELFGGGDADQLFGGSGEDSLIGGDDGDTLFGDVGDDVLWGSDGADTLFGSEGDDVLNGATGQTSLGADGEVDGADTLFGGGGADKMLLGEGDMARGGAGADTFVVDEAVLGGTALAEITDFDGAEDTLELEYTAGTDAAGDPLDPPVVTVVDFADGTGAFLQLDGVAVASVTGAQGLNPDDVVLTVA